MIATVPIFTPSRANKVQSPWLYLQSAGSTGADGSTYGAHVRWLLLRNLGDSHLPKGDLAATTLGFNRPDDYVTLLRSRYEQRFAKTVDFSEPPKVVNDALSFWIYVVDPDTTVYVHFRDAAKYALVRAKADPATAPERFVAAYCPSLIETELKNRLFFAAELDVARDRTTVMRAEALSVESNVPLSPLFVSCRKTFRDDNWCPPPETASPVLPSAIFTGGSSGETLPDCCGGPNLISDGSFELRPVGGVLAWSPPANFSTDYILQGRTQAGTIHVTQDARFVNGAWRGRPHSGISFLTVDGSTSRLAAVVRYRFEVDPFTDYCFAGWLATLWAQDVSIPLEVRITTPAGTQTFPLTTPATVEVWEPFDIDWSSGDSRTAIVEIVSLSTDSIGNDFGIDDLTFCKKRRLDCRARIASENIRSIRFDVDGGHPRSIQFEIYDDYIAAAQWEVVDKFALTDSDAVAFTRLDPSPAQWQKFNDGALLNVANYRDRWTRAGGLKEGVQKYITLSNSDPLAVTALSGDVQPQDGSISVSMLDALRMVSLDFHNARMLGLGHLDRNITADSERWIYLAVYDTDGKLDDVTIPSTETDMTRGARHLYMGVPTSPLDARLPDAPRLTPVQYGLAVDNRDGDPAMLTDANGYTFDGVARYVNVFVEPETDGAPLGPFYVPPEEFCAIDKTSAVFYGVEYRKKGEAAWRKPEIAHDAAYKDLDTPPQFETLPMPNNAGNDKPILRHEEREAGVHEYGAYGINWFSRVSPVGNMVATDATAFQKPKTLLPPANFAVQLIQPESPLMLTTQNEQQALHDLSGPDKTLVRVSFDYFAAHDVNYQFADTVELFFRSEMPRNVVGALVSVADAPGDPHQAVLHTTSYALNSQGTSVAPSLDSSLYPNFVGGVLSCRQENYIITAVTDSTVMGEGPVFTVEKVMRGKPANPGGGAYITVQEWIAPVIDSSTQVMFMAVENMASPASWPLPNPLARKVTIGDASWTTQQETVIKDGDAVTVTLRGIWATATAQQDSVDPSVYRIEFAAYTLARHPQSGDLEPVDWYKGIIRVPRANDPNGPKKVLDVLLIEHLGESQPLAVWAADSAFDPADPIALNQPVTVNYYPGYRLYLHAASGFDESTILPAPKEGTRKTWLAARAVDRAAQFSSPIGTVAPIVAIEQIDPVAPRQPVGPEYATWPDFFYKCSYTFTVDFEHEPFSVAFYRANDNAVLHALYKDETYDAVRRQLALLGDDDPDRSGRWRDLLGFQYAGGKFAAFGTTTPWAFPNPDKGGPLDGSDPGAILDAVKTAVRGAFTPLTEIPLVYDYINGPSYAPTSRRQNIRNAQGTLLSFGDPEFEIAPMAKKTGNGFELQFTDFTLDGTGKNLFFYCAREIGNRGRIGEASAIAGPVQLINARPAEAPAVKRIVVQENPPAVVFEVSAYPEVQRVARMLIYRTSDPADALSVRTMEVVKTIDVDAAAVAAKPLIVLADDFENGFVPFGDPLFYRIVALRKVRKPDGSTDWVPSHASKTLLTTMIDTRNPEPPEITATSSGVSGAPAAMSGVALSWSPTAYNGTYYLDKMTAVGTWQNIYQVKTNQAVTVALLATDLATDALLKQDPDDERTVVHRFRVRVQNSSGLFNLTDKILTL